MNTNEKILFLGDSYTIGEGVQQEVNFPNKLIKKLNESLHLQFEALIIAKTGWTTSMLLHEISAGNIENDFKIATLLIGVNNQFRGLDTALYINEFEKLLRNTISAVKTPTSVIVISIPDWGSTPFARNRETAQITEEINWYNDVNRALALEHHVHYLDITTGNKIRSLLPQYICNDDLHPSEMEYDIWAEALFELIIYEKLHR